MTELERPLTAALERLSAQYETEQQRQSEQVAALQQRVEQQATFPRVVGLLGLPVPERRPEAVRHSALSRLDQSDPTLVV